MKSFENASQLALILKSHHSEIKIIREGKI